MSEKRKDWKDVVDALWAIAPDWAVAHTISAIGVGHWHEQLPIKEDNMFYTCNMMVSAFFHYLNFGDWRETLIERPKENERPFEPGDIIAWRIVEDGPFRIGVIQRRLNKEGFIVLFKDGKNGACTANFMRHATPEEKIAYQKATINDALTDPADVVGEYMTKMQERLGLDPDTKYSFVRQDEGKKVDGILDMIAKDEETERNRQRWQMQRDVFVAMYSHPYSDSFKIEVLLEHVENHTNAFFERFGYSI